MSCSNVTNKNMKYSVEQLIQRAKNLADLGNTDFLSHTELTQYVNDAWTTLYQWLINQGDKQFVTEVSLRGTGVGNYVEYEIPHDLYQIISIKSKWGGLLTRHADSQGRNHNGTYEVINNKIRIYSGLDDLILTYYRIPLFLTFPDETLRVDLTGRSVISSAGNAVLLNDGEIRNVLSGEVLGKINLTDDRDYKLGNGHVVETYITDAVLTDTWSYGEGFLNSDLTSMSEPEGTVNESQVITNPSGTTIKDSNNNLYIRTLAEGEYEFSDIGLIQIGTENYKAVDLTSPAANFLTGWTFARASNAPFDQVIIYNDTWYNRVDEGGTNQYYPVLGYNTSYEAVVDTVVSDELLIQELEGLPLNNVYKLLATKNYHGFYTVTGFTKTAITRSQYVINGNVALGTYNPAIQGDIDLWDELNEAEAITVSYLEYRKAAGAYLTYFDYIGNVLYSTTSQDSSYSLCFDEEFNIYWQIMRLGGYGNLYLMNRLEYEYEGTEAIIQVLDNDYWKLYHNEDELYLESINYGEIFRFDFIPEEIVRTDDWELSKCFIIRDTNEKFHLLILHEPNVIEQIDLDIKAFNTLALLKYGPLTTNGTSVLLQSHIPDTALNFPNELYFSLIAADLGLRFACKINANTDGLNSIYTNMKNQYLNSLGQDGDYLRIKNVYGAR